METASYSWARVKREALINAGCATLGKINEVGGRVEWVGISRRQGRKLPLIEKEKGYF